ncbi:MAG: hypothetical protein ACR2NR_00895 [Solirubrobacteraceae bacterium]
MFGDTYVVEGGYAARCLKFGAERVVLVDTLETPAWLEARLGDHRLDFLKGDFSDRLFMSSIREQFDVSVAFDVLLHQPPLLGTLHDMLEKTTQRIAIVQPMLKERDVANTLIYLPGSPSADGLYPLRDADPGYRMFDVHEVNQSHWIWAMTPSFLRSALDGEGFAIVREETLGDLPNPQWQWWGAVAERRPHNPHHWSRHSSTPGVAEPAW